MSRVSEVVIPKAQGFQVDVLADIRRFLLCHAGRRGGKTRTGFIAGTLGRASLPNGRGMLAGGNVVWVPPTIPQGRAIWREEVVPRFKGVPGFQVKETERVVFGPNGGSLEIISAEAIDSARGRKFDGAILDEGREYDLEYVWNSVIRPCLIDRRGWALFLSSTRAGSTFNTMCEEVRDGTRNARLWGRYHWRTRDNPLLSPEEIEEIYAEYVGRESVMQEELDALLLTGGAGLGFPEWMDDLSAGVHVVPRRVIPQGWRYVAGIDWGYVKGCYVLAAIGPEGHVEVIWEKILERQHAKDAGKQVLTECPWLPRPDYIAADTQMWSETGTASSIADEFMAGMLEASGNSLSQMPQLLPMRHGPGARVASKNVIHKMLSWKDQRENGTLVPWARPKLRIQEQCSYIRKTFRSIPADPKNPEDVNTKADDHGYDAIRYLIGSMPEAPEVAVHSIAQDLHPGYDIEAKRRRSKIHPWEARMREQEPDGYDVPTTTYWRPGA